MFPTSRTLCEDRFTDYNSCPYPRYASLFDFNSEKKFFSTAEDLNRHLLLTLSIVIVVFDLGSVEFFFLELIERKMDYCRYETRFLTKDGQTRWMEVYAQLAQYSDGTVLGTFSRNVPKNSITSCGT